jgi:hypothetical protein
MRNARHGFSSLKGSNQLQSHRHHPQLPVQIVVELSVCSMSLSVDSRILSDSKPRRRGSMPSSYMSADTST